MLANRYGGCAWETFGSAGFRDPVLHTYAQLPPLSKCKRNGVSSLNLRDIPMIKPTPNPPEHEATSPYESFDSKKLHEAAERALDHHLGTPAG